jgi:hypothetical protein
VSITMKTSFKEKFNVSIPLCQACIELMKIEMNLS